MSNSAVSVQAADSEAVVVVSCSSGDADDCTMPTDHIRLVLGGYFSPQPVNQTDMQPVSCDV